MNKDIKGLTTSGLNVERPQIIYVRRKGDANLRQIDLSDTNMYVGSAIKGQDTLRGLSFEEEKVYLKDIIGVSPNSDKWEAATKEYWSNIRVPIPIGDGKMLEIGFRYASEEDANLAEKSNDFTIKQLYGVPIEVGDYIFYRYCLQYKRVARSINEIYKSANIAFYMFSKVDDIADKKRASQLRDKAFIKRMEILNDRQLVDDILVLFGYFPDKMSSDEKDIELEIIVNTNPEKFVSVTNNPNIKSKAFIERCITAGLLKRLYNTDTIVYGDNTILGGNIEEAITTLYRSSASSTEILNTLKSRLSQIGKGLTPEKPIEITVSDIPLDLDVDLSPPLVDPPPVDNKNKKSISFDN